MAAVQGRHFASQFRGRFSTGMQISVPAGRHAPPLELGKCVQSDPISVAPVYGTSNYCDENKNKCHAAVRTASLTTQLTENRAQTTICFNDFRSVPMPFHMSGRELQ